MNKILLFIMLFTITELTLLGGEEEKEQRVSGGYDNSGSPLVFTRYVNNYYLRANAAADWKILSAEVTGGSLISYGEGYALGHTILTMNNPEAFSLAVHGTIAKSGGGGGKVPEFHLHGAFRGVLSASVTPSILALGDSVILHAVTGNPGENDNIFSWSIYNENFHIDLKDQPESTEYTPEESGIYYAEILGASSSFFSSFTVVEIDHMDGYINDNDYVAGYSDSSSVGKLSICAGDIVFLQVYPYPESEWPDLMPVWDNGETGDISIFDEEEVGVYNVWASCGISFVEMNIAMVGVGNISATTDSITKSSTAEDKGDITANETLYISKGTKVTFSATSNPNTEGWPSDEQPVWKLDNNEQKSWEGQSTFENTFNSAGTFYVSAHCGESSRIIKVIIPDLTLRIDSNNDGTVSADDDVDKMTAPGKILEINHHDINKDGIPDYADGYDTECGGVSGANRSAQFAPLHIILPDNIEFSEYQIKFSYNSSNPAALTFNVSTGHYNPAIGTLRLWTKDGNQARLKASVNAETAPGDYIPSGTAIPLDKIFKSGREVIVYVEAVGTSRDISTISASLIPNDGSITVTDEVCCTMIGVKLDFPDPIPGKNSLPAGSDYDTILVTNDADQSESALIPDYANPARRVYDDSLLQMNMTIYPGSFNGNNLKLKFEYDGLPELSNFVGTEITSGLDDIYQKGSRKYYDYTALKKGTMRFWYGENLTERSARDYRKYSSANGGNYFAPADTQAKALRLSDLVSQLSIVTNLKFWLEGINAKEKAPVKATLLYQNGNGWIEIASDEVNVKVMEGKLRINTNNDPQYELDELDGKIKDQHDGFWCWYASSFDNIMSDQNDQEAENGPRSTHGFENLFALQLKNLPPLPPNMKYEVRLNHNGVIVANPYSSRLDYLKSASQKQTLLASLKDATNKFTITENSKTSDYELLFGIYNQSAEPSTRITLILYPDKDRDFFVTLDSCRYTVQNINKFFWMGSTRGTANVSYDYPTEDGRIVTNFQTYPDVTAISGFAENYDSDKDILIFLHGFNVGLDSAIKSNRTIFRRLYWSGYRANYIGITWEGTYGTEGVLSKVNFDVCVERALRSSRSINKFISQLPKINDVNIMAHSLGNLVMWDALRLEQYKPSPSILAFNILSIQAAIWEEMFYGYDGINYLSEPDPANNISYSIDDLQHHSWAFWLNQGTKNASKSYSGVFCNSSTNNDYALVGQKQWNSTPNSDAFKRTNNATTYRTPNTLPLLYPLMQKGSRLPYNIVYANLYFQCLNSPIGMTYGVGDKNVLASRYGWNSAAHSDFKDIPFYDIVRWYKQVFSIETQIIEGL